MMVAGFQRDEESASGGRGAGLPERVDFGMRTAKEFVMTFANQPQIAIDDHGTDRGIGFDATQTPAGQFQGTPHHGNIIRKWRGQSGSHNFFSLLDD
jgi:hypothetical protein